jgi:hypothetical protein
VLYLGFLKFLKRDKDKELDVGIDDNLDVPPPPPDFVQKNFNDLDKGLPEFPELPKTPESEGLPELPKLEDEMPIENFDVQKMPREKTLPPLNFPEDVNDDYPDEKPLPKLEIPHEDMPRPHPMPRPEMKPQRPLFPVRSHSFPKLTEQSKLPGSKHKLRPSPYQALEKRASREEIGILRHKKAKGPTYVRIEKFRDIITSTGTMKNNLRIASQSIERLNEIDDNRDKVFDKWHNVMMDMQKKFIFMDKSVFKKSR